MANRSASLRQVREREFCRRYPAFLDCALSLMHRPAMELREMVSENVCLGLGQGMSRCVGFLIDALGDSVDDPEYVANVLWTQVLGTTHLELVGVGIRSLGPGQVNGPASRGRPSGSRAPA
jgi:hypothetical protein